MVVAIVKRLSEHIERLLGQKILVVAGRQLLGGWPVPVFRIPYSWNSWL